MGEMTADDVQQALAALNPRARREDVVIYADSLMMYREAAENIRRNGNIVAHPRTNAPIENPYLRVRARAIAEMRKCERIVNTGDLWDIA